MYTILVNQEDLTLHQSETVFMEERVFQNHGVCRQASGMWRKFFFRMRMLATQAWINKKVEELENLENG